MRRPRLATLVTPLVTFVAAIVVAAAPVLAWPAESGYAGRPEVRQFIGEMAEKHGFAPASLERLFAAARYQPGIVRAMTTSAESAQRSWQAYRALFVNPERIQAGLRFRQANREALDRAAEAYGVPGEILVAIIGVETQYGRNVGGYRVIDALTTLAFDFPQRSEFFRSELEQYLLFTREERLSPLNLKGSYAGAIGIAQFMPGSYRRFAVDFDGDGRRDLSRSVTDAVGSIGNYLREHGWQSGAPIAVRSRIEAPTDSDGIRKLLDVGVKPSLPGASIGPLGILLAEPVPADALCSLVELPTPGQESEFWVGLENFYVLTRYNRSSFYSVAVIELARAIDAAARDRR